MKRLIRAVLLAAVVVPFASAGSVYAASLGGTWSGTGTITSATGKTERARCRVTYSKSGASSYKVNARCASTSGKAVQSATVRPTGKNKYAGNFYNSKHNARGSVSITLRGNRQTVSMSSSVGSATMSLKRR